MDDWISRSELLESIWAMRSGHEKDGVGQILFEAICQMIKQHPGAERK